MEDVEPVRSSDSGVEIAPTDATSDLARACLRRYYDELDDRFAGGFDHARSVQPDESVMNPPGGLFLVARLLGEPVGCGGFVLRAGEGADLKRMWVAPQARGLGLGRRLLVELEGRAARLGARSLQLETNSTLVEAIALYRGAGYQEVPAFNDEPHADHWFQKLLDPPGEQP